MSSFICEKCNTECIEVNGKYITGCNHYPLRKTDTVDKQRREDTLSLLTKVSQELGMYDE